MTSWRDCNVLSAIHTDVRIRALYTWEYLKPPFGTNDLSVRTDLV
jgi:hypothetical protein